MRFRRLVRIHSTGTKTPISVVVEHSPGIAVYTNSDGNIVVRQHDYPDNSFVIICPKDVRRVAKAITEAAR